MKASLFAAAVFLFSIVANINVDASSTKAFDPGLGDYAVSIPASLESRVIKETAENSVAYKFKKSDGSTQFLFSINKTSFEQWLKIREQLPDATLIGEKSGFIYYAETTTRQSLKGPDKDAYADAYANLGAIVQSIKL